MLFKRIKSHLQQFIHVETDVIIRQLLVQLLHRSNKAASDESLKNSVQQNLTRVRHNIPHQQTITQQYNLKQCSGPADLI